MTGCNELETPACQHTGSIKDSAPPGSCNLDGATVDVL